MKLSSIFVTVAVAKELAEPKDQLAEIQGHINFVWNKWYGSQACQLRVARKERFIDYINRVEKKYERCGYFNPELYPKWGGPPTGKNRNRRADPVTTADYSMFENLYNLGDEWYDNMMNGDEAEDEAENEAEDEVEDKDNDKDVGEKDWVFNPDTDMNDEDAISDDAQCEGGICRVSKNNVNKALVQIGKLMARFAKRYLTECKLNPSGETTTNVIKKAEKWVKTMKDMQCLTK